MLKCTLL